MSNRPAATAGLRHVAIFVHQYEACVDFYTKLVGMSVEWRPDENNVYLSSGNDNLALHRILNDIDSSGFQRMDHIGFILNTPQDVDVWHDFLLRQGVKIKNKPRTHRDGARSFYCFDPDTNTVQFIYHPPLCDTTGWKK